MNPERPKPHSFLGTHRAILSLLPSQEKKHIVDLGAGEGALTEKVIALGHTVTACDVNPEGFKLPDCVFRKADFLKKLPFGDAEFDIAILADVIEHLEDPWTIVREAYRIVKPGGTLILSTPNIMSLSARVHFMLHGEHWLFYPQEAEGQAYPHITPLNYQQLERILTKSGFRIANVVSNAPFINECDEWERECMSWCFPARKPRKYGILNLIGLLIKLKVKISKYAYKNEAILSDTFFNGQAIIIEAHKT